MQSDKRKRYCEWRVPLTAEKKLIVIAYLLEVIHSGEKNFGLVLSRRLHPARLSLVRPMVLCFLLCAFSVGADFFQIPTNPTRMRLGFKWPNPLFPPLTRRAILSRLLWTRDETPCVIADTKSQKPKAKSNHNNGGRDLQRFTAPVVVEMEPEPLRL